MTRYDDIRAIYDAAGQSHVFTFYPTLSPSDQSSFLDQLESIDVHRVNRIYRNAVAADPPVTPPASDTDVARSLDPNDTLLASGANAHGARLIATSPSRTPEPEEVRPLPEEACATVLNNPREEDRWRQIGLDAIARSETAVLLMAGGQGSRLGSSLPKGMYDVSLPSHRTLFEIQAARIAKLEQLAANKAGKTRSEVNIRWYVMTSGPTRTNTQQYFAEKNYFGLKPDNVVFFEQGVLPALSNDGKLLLATPSSLSVAPDGNGGLYSALRRPYDPSKPSQTILGDLRAKGIKYIHVYGVDNCLVRVADPVFFGACIERQCAVGAKVVRKTIPTESVGVLAQRGDVFSVVEYSELSKEKAELRDATGQLAFRAANIVNHFFTLEFLESVEAMERKMAFHIARKKIPTLDLATGEKITPTSPNGMKLELFVFDVFPYTSSMCVLEVDRAEEFSGLKNAPGSKTDSPETSRRDLLAQHYRWIIAAGAEVAEGIEVELFPSVTYSGEGLETLQGKKFVRSGVVESIADVDKLV